MFGVDTIRWQCSGCDHLCVMLTDKVMRPEEVVKCLAGKWRRVIPDELAELRKED